MTDDLVIEMCEVIAKYTGFDTKDIKYAHDIFKSFDIVMAAIVVISINGGGDLFNACSKLSKSVNVAKELTMIELLPAWEFGCGVIK